MTTPFPNYFADYTKSTETLPCTTPAILMGASYGSAHRRARFCDRQDDVRRLQTSPFDDAWLEEKITFFPDDGIENLTSATITSPKETLPSPAFTHPSQDFEMYETAALVMGDAESMFAAIGYRPGAAQRTRRLGDVLLSQRRYEQAAQALEQAKASLTFFYAGYGVLGQDTNEALIPSDSYPPFFDMCHSGTALDLPFSYAVGDFPRRHRPALKVQQPTEGADKSSRPSETSKLLAYYAGHGAPNISKQALHRRHYRRRSDRHPRLPDCTPASQCLRTPLSHSASPRWSSHRSGLSSLP
ncbi:hypothetical protein CALCODRAFT_558163 [Calocera cornea HHB12733]|uniref:Uncharacterized protein n=1 Tax=Calocera cornea HHB12733 TaxID=1353952 RepID=A0A165D7Z7_9BASI|nr:hypothetical protein CALCODRAFT_558163 [Calocera cornea HHB12733]